MGDLDNQNARSVLPEDILKAVWSFGDESKIKLEFYYNVSNIHKEIEKQVIEVKVLGSNPQSHTLTIMNPSFDLQIPPGVKNHGIDGVIKADYSHKIVCFEGKILGKIKPPVLPGVPIPPCAPFDPRCKRIFVRTHNCIVFNWF
ncbi:MAG: hypothetical protein N2645_04370 [Clostridia bacterium]|nr:hypothetical protein [Clostridia bacterium]